jgi:hypothetical protein
LLAKKLKEEKDFLSKSGVLFPVEDAEDMMLKIKEKYCHHYHHYHHY